MYRYSLKKFNSQLLTRGMIRIGTLYDFRRLEHKKGVCDAQEGKKVVAHHIKNLFVTDPLDPVYKYSMDFRSLEEFPVIKLTPDAKYTTLSNITVGQDYDSKDLFILCTSKYCSEHTMRQFDGADSCLEIVNVNNFYHVLTEMLNSITSVIYRGIHKVEYLKNKEEPWSGRHQDRGLDPALIKELVFKPQGELRAIWEPKSNAPIKPLIIENNRLGKFCRIIRM